MKGAWTMMTIVGLMAATVGCGPQLPSAKLSAPDPGAQVGSLPETATAEQLVTLPEHLIKSTDGEMRSVQQDGTWATMPRRSFRYYRFGSYYYPYYFYGGNYHPYYVYADPVIYRPYYYYANPYLYPRSAPYYGGYQSPDGSFAQVLVQNYAYYPSSVRVRQGGQVNWINRDQVAHTATSPLPGTVSTYPFDRELPPGGQGSITFGVPGTWGYYCRYHPSMRGQVTVIP